MTEQRHAGRTRKLSFFQPQDFAWALFIAVLLLTAPETNNDALILVPIIGAFQIVEPRFAVFHSKAGQAASIALKLLLCYFLLGFSDTIYSYYYPLFLIPIVSAATLFDIGAVIGVAVLATASYFSFLLPAFIDWNLVPPREGHYPPPPGHLSLMCLRASFFFIVGFLVYQQARAKREEMARTEEALERLVESNRNLQVAEASLRRSERLAALGQLTAGLAHELRNPLGTIKGSAEMLAGQVAQHNPEIAAEMAGYIVAEVDRMNGLIASFLDFARPLRIKVSMNEIRPVVEDVMRQLRELAHSRGVSVIANTDEPELAFSFDREMLRIALSNLIQNAVQASSKGQEVAVRVASDAELIRILVTDHGEGIQPQDLENIFNPFFTTKPQGVGLGLALVTKIVDEHGGRVNVFSQPGAGTTFEVTLPREPLA